MVAARKTKNSTDNINNKLQRTLRSSLCVKLLITANDCPPSEV
ncbi:hypothetical protein ACP4OV_021084 [Aristida adscensionis]